MKPVLYIQSEVQSLFTGINYRSITSYWNGNTPKSFHNTVLGYIISTNLIKLTL